MRNSFRAAVVVALLWTVATSTGRAAPPAKFPDILHTPASAYVGAAADAEAILAAGDDPTHYLWVSAYNRTTPEACKTDYALTALVTNMLNFTRPKLLLPHVVNDRLFRVDLYGLGIKRSVVDELVSKGSGTAPSPQPFFHFQQEYEGKQILAVPNWVSKAQALRLVTLAGTEYPVVRADWFVNYALQPPAYYKFAGDPKDLADIQKLAGVNYDAAKKKSRVQLSGAVLFSEVGNYNRRLERTPTDTNYGQGCYMRSFDYLRSTKGKNVIKNPLIEDEDAGEHIWVMPNGLHGYGLTNAQRKVVEAGDSKIVADQRSPLHDRTLYVGARCFFCHSKGTIPVEDELRLTGEGNLAFLLTDAKKAAKSKRAKAGPKVTIDAGEAKNMAEFEVHLPAGAKLTINGQGSKQTGSPRTFTSPVIDAGGSYEFEAVAGDQKRKVEVAFLPGQKITIDFREAAPVAEENPDADRVYDNYFGADFNNFLGKDSQNFLASVRACTGQDAAAVALKLQEVMRAYSDQPLTLDLMAIEYGYHPDVVQRLVADVGRVANLDPVHLAMLKRRKGRRDQFEESFGQVMQLLVLVPEAKK